MTTTAAEPAAVAAALVRELVGAEGGADGGLATWGAAQWESLPRAELLALQRELVAQRRRLDAPLATAAAEIDRRSQREDGAAGLSRREGFPTAAKQVAGATGGSTGEAHRLIEVGRTLLNASRPDDARDRHDASSPSDDSAGRTAQTPRFVTLARAVSEGKLSIDSANAISAMLTRVADVVEPELLKATERDLVERAQTLPYDRLSSMIRQCEAHLDQETARMREEARYNSRYLNIFENRQGMIVIDGRLDLETGAPVKAAIDAMVGDALHRRRDREDSEHGDDRSVPQMRADALADLAKHGLGCDSGGTTLPKATVMVRIGYEALKSGVGMGEIDGFDEPVSAGMLRRMAADAEIIPMVMGGKSVPLDVGRARRLFTKEQKLALIERDGGCAWCHAPPSWCEAHHIRWWERDFGETNLDNGVMLCTSCHKRIHRDHWGIEVRDGTVWFIPPVAIDPTRTPIQGGRARFQYAKAA